MPAPAAELRLLRQYGEQLDRLRVVLVPHGVLRLLHRLSQFLRQQRRVARGRHRRRVAGRDRCAGHRRGGIVGDRYPRLRVAEARRVQDLPGVLLRDERAGPQPVPVLPVHVRLGHVHRDAGGLGGGRQRGGVVRFLRGLEVDRVGDARAGRLAHGDLAAARVRADQQDPQPASVVGRHQHVLLARGPLDREVDVVAEHAVGRDLLDDASIADRRRDHPARRRGAAVRARDQAHVQHLARVGRRVAQVADRAAEHHGHREVRALARDADLLDEAGGAVRARLPGRQGERGEHQPGRGGRLAHVTRRTWCS